MRATGTTLDATRAEAVSVRRFVNDFIATRAARFHDTETAAEFICECGDLACHGVVNLTLAEYRATTRGSVVAHND